MKKFVVEYRYQADFMEEESHAFVLIETGSANEVKAEVCKRHLGMCISVDSITECVAEDWSVDLCDGNKTVATFDIPGLYPVEGVPGGDVYFALLGDAKANAERIIKGKYPMFFAKLNEVRKHRCGLYLQKAEDSMVIIRPKKWVREGTNAYLVTVFYRQDGKVTHFSVNIRAKDSTEASHFGKERVMRCYASCEFLSVLVMRAAESPSLG